MQLSNTKYWPVGISFVVDTKYKLGGGGLQDFFWGGGGARFCKSINFMRIDAIWLRIFSLHVS